MWSGPLRNECKVETVAGPTIHAVRTFATNATITSGMIMLIFFISVAHPIAMRGLLKH